MSHEAVERFLWEVMGYRKIKDLLDGKKDRKTGIRDFLDGTVFGSFKPLAEGGPEVERVKMPGILKIRPTEESLPKQGKPVPLFMEAEVGERVLRLPYSLGSVAFFHGYTRKGMEEFLHKINRDLFPSAEYALLESVYLHRGARILDEDFYFGLMLPPHTREFSAYFDVDPELVDEINKLQAKYHAMINQGYEEIDWTAGKDYTDAQEYYLANMIGQVPDEELVRLLKQVERLPYQPRSSYAAGQPIEHQKFGSGIVQSVQRNRITVYFPELGESKTLAQNYSSQQ